MKKSYLFATAFAVAGTALRIYQWYFSKPLWVDEEMVLLNVRDRAFSELLGPLWLNQAAPLGWLALQRSAVTVFGTNDIVVRAVPVSFAIAMLWIALWMGKRWMNPLAAAVFLLLCGTAQWMTHYAVEAKPYSADAFWALTLLALAIWAAQPAAGHAISLAKTGVWWSAAALGQWFSFAATFVTPGFALVLCTIGYRRAGWRAAAAIALQGLIFLTLFAVHYAVSISYAHHDEYLRDYWRLSFPPISAEFTATAEWLAQQIKPLSDNPGGTTVWIGFVLAVAYGAGISLTRQPALGLVILSVPATAIILTAFRLLPLADRLVLWTVPPLYAAVAVAVDDLIAGFRASLAPRHWTRIAFAASFSVLSLWVCADIVDRGRTQFYAGGNNHGLDDRRSMRLLMAQRQHGDVILTTHLGLPAVWWYAAVPISDPGGGSRHPHDGTPIFEMTYIPRGEPGCRGRARNQLAETLAGSRRASVYLGFASRFPPDFQHLVLDELSALGTAAVFRQVSEGIVAIFDFTLPPSSWRSNLDAVNDHRLMSDGRKPSCIGVQLAQRW
jgi:hypothetical protein